MTDASLLRDIFDAGVTRVRGEHAVANWLRHHPDLQYNSVFAVGKAAAAMTLGAMRERDFERGLVITKHDHLEPELQQFPQLDCLESDHPVPGDASLNAGQKLITFLEQAPAEATFLALISGGASSLAEALAPGLDLDALEALTQCLLREGLTINEMNAVRRSISRIKGGRLAHYLKGRATCALLISDVPGDDPAVIGSGPLTPVRDEVIPDTLNPTVRDILERATPMPVPEPEAFAHLQTHIIATLDDAKTAAAKKAQELGLAVHVHSEFLEGEAEEVGRQLATFLRQPETPDGVHIWGGETTVHLPDQPGRGGRNQQLALAAACALDGAEGVEFLSCGTDGSDGPTQDAGGLVDGSTLEHGRAQNLDATDFLGRADAGTYLEAVAALVTTGPTGTNVMDLVLANKQTH